MIFESRLTAIRARIWLVVDVTHSRVLVLQVQSTSNLASWKYRVQFIQVYQRWRRVRICERSLNRKVKRRRTRRQWWKDPSGRLRERINERIIWISASCRNWRVKWWRSGYLYIVVDGSNFLLDLWSDLMPNTSMIRCCCDTRTPRESLCVLWSAPNRFIWRSHEWIRLYRRNRRVSHPLNQIKNKANLKKCDVVLTPQSANQTPETRSVVEECSMWSIVGYSAD